MTSVTADSIPPPPARSRKGSGVRRRAPSLEEVYDEWFDFVWRSARRLGVDEDATDDVVQDVFLVVHRQLPSFEGRSSLKTWLFGITRNVVRDHRRARRRRRPAEPLRESWVDGPKGAEPLERAVRSEAAELLHRLLQSLDDDKREVFVLAELEQMSIPEIGAALSINVNTAYSRLRAARHAFNEAVARHRARDERRLG
jgi:RNA polymerase sigma-70 factor (ECF subfamily)